MKTVTNLAKDQRVSRLSLIACVITFILSALMLCDCPGFAVVMGVFTIFPILRGPPAYRFIGIIALVCAVAYDIYLSR